jgi:formate-dependent phosphoribosylglycinamide formyltransferase (GAR transformylase)
MHVVFVEPAFPRNQREFVRALHAVGARVTGIGERTQDALDGELKGWLHRYEQIPSVTNEPALLAAVRRVQAREWVDRLEATVEAHILPTAHVREACTIPGTSARTAFLCRDKPAMKEALRAAGVPCAQSIGTSSPAEAREFAQRVGFPLILKPRDSAGAAGTYRAGDAQELEQALRASGLADGRPAAVEEFIEGHEGFYDTLTIGGRVVHEFVSHYYPNVLEAMRTRWISPQVVTTNRVTRENYGELMDLGARVIRALGIGTSATHMEWFFGPKGLKFSEIGCRPPGVLVWDLYGAANDMDLYLEWAKAIVHGETETRPSRRFAAGMIALRPDRDGRISHYDGVEELRRRHGPWLIDQHFPAPGTATQGVEAGYMANAWVRLKYPDYDGLRAVMDDIGRTVKVHAH